MYITITAQKLGDNYSRSSKGFVDYLMKENREKGKEQREYFFDQYNDQIPEEEVVFEIDRNTAKLEKKEPRFYSITVNPSKYELKHLQNSSKDLKKFTRELMKDYVASFNREINGRPVRIEDIKYYAIIEHQRTFKGHDKQVKENQQFADKILHLKNELRKLDREESHTASRKSLEQEIAQLEKQAPHQQNGKRIVQRMLKDGPQCHVHIIVSRKDASNRYSLSPGSKYKDSEVSLNGKMIRRGFDRDKFFQNAEKTFDRTFVYHRNLVENYTFRKEFIKHPKIFFEQLLKLPVSQKAIAFKILRESGMPTMPGISPGHSQLALKLFNQLRRGVDIAVKSSSMGI